MNNAPDPVACPGGTCRIDPLRLRKARQGGIPAVSGEVKSGIMIFTKSECPICVKAKEVVDSFLADRPEIRLVVHDLDTVDGLVEASMRNTLEVPTILVLADGREKSRWEGRAPAPGELASALGG